MDIQKDDVATAGKVMKQSKSQLNEKQLKGLEATKSQQVIPIDSIRDLKLDVPSEEMEEFMNDLRRDRENARKLAKASR